MGKAYLWLVYANKTHQLDLSEAGVRVFDRWCVPNIWTLSHDASFGHEMPLFCQWEFDQVIRKHTET